MDVPLSAILGFVGSLLAVFATIYLALLRYAIAQKEAEINRRFDESAKTNAEASRETDVEMKKLSDRIMAEEKSSIEMAGRMNVVLSQHTGIKDDIDEVKRNMVTKNEFQTLTLLLNQVLGRYRSGSEALPSSPYGTKKT